MISAIIICAAVLRLPVPYDAVVCIEIQHGKYAVYSLRRTGVRPEIIQGVKAQDDLPPLIQVSFYDGLYVSLQRQPVRIEAIKR